MYHGRLRHYINLKKNSERSREGGEMGKSARKGTVRGEQVSHSPAGTRPEPAGADQSVVWQVVGERHCGVLL